MATVDTTSSNTKESVGSLEPVIMTFMEIHFDGPWSEWHEKRKFNDAVDPKYVVTNYTAMGDSAKIIVTKIDGKSVTFSFSKEAQVRIEQNRFRFNHVDLEKS